MDKYKFFIVNGDKLIQPFQMAEYKGRFYAVRWKIVDFASAEVKYGEALEWWGNALIGRGFLKDGAGKGILFSDKNFWSYADPRVFKELRNALFAYDISEIANASQGYPELKLRVNENLLSLSFPAADDAVLFEAKRIDHLKECILSKGEINAKFDSIGNEALEKKERLTKFLHTKFYFKYSDLIQLDLSELEGLLDDYENNRRPRIAAFI